MTGPHIIRFEWPWNPKHKYRFYTFQSVRVPCWLFTIRFSNNDQSLFIIPLLRGPFSIQSLQQQQRVTYTHHPGADFHLSLHESGVVNITTSEARARLRREFPVRKDPRHVITFQINSIANFLTTTIEEVNKTNGRRLAVPLVGFPQSPLMLSVFCAREKANWSPPPMGNTMMEHYKTKMIGKDYNFLFVSWQNLQMPRGEGDVAIQFGEENDIFGGL